MLMEDCHFGDFRIRSDGGDMNVLMAKPMRCIYGEHKTPEPGILRNCSFTNVQVVGEPGEFKGLLYMLGDSEKHHVRGMRFKNIRYFDQPITANSPSVSIGQFAADVTFE